ncbi:methyltransferase domain-containing protein [Streptomyces sp. AM6-12]|uniref:methyltransferase domain-containing protein n=1 Tax=Streptomyces sp. AM6-12 TaxID=3345149 RepID=UPI0037A05583
MPPSHRTLEPDLQQGFYEHQLARIRHHLTARALSRLPEPESWLDVGTGEGRFPEAAKRFFPYTSFDGVDPTDRVERALAEGRVEEAYRGGLPDVAPRLHSRYDVVSLLGPPTDPADLRCAYLVLRPGGHIVLGAGWSPTAAEIPPRTLLTGIHRIPFLSHHRIVARKPTAPELP